MEPLIRIGTRGSPLALWQARAVQARLAEAAGIPAERIELVVIRTTGDRIQDRPLSEAGGKGLFTKEIDQALLDGVVDIAVHSAKDMETQLAPGTRIAACLPRGDIRDALITRNGGGFSEIPPGGLVGTASLRRAALVRRKRPDLETATLRGNVETRLRRLQEGVFDATLLALAGLARLSLADRASELLDPHEFPPALGQGAVAIAARNDDRDTAALLAGVDDVATSTALACERAFLAELDGSCRMPIAGLAEIEGGRLRFSGLVLSPDGVFEERAAIEGAAEHAAQLGAEAGRDLRARLPADFLAIAGASR
jgi:hydroxymethylbilane synthase